MMLESSRDAIILPTLQDDVLNSLFNFKRLFIILEVSRSRFFSQNILTWAMNLCSFIWVIFLSLHFYTKGDRFGLYIIYG